MNITPEIFLAELKNNKSEFDLNRLEHPSYSYNEINYKTSPRYMSQMFDDEMHYCNDKLQIKKYKELL